MHKKRNKNVDWQKRPLHTTAHSALSFPFPLVLRITITSASSSSSSSTLSTAVLPVPTLPSSSMLVLRPKILLSPLNPLWLLLVSLLRPRLNNEPEEGLRLKLRLPELALRFKLLPSSTEEPSCASRFFLGSSDFAFHAAW